MTNPDDACNSCPVGTTTGNNTENECLPCNPGSYNNKGEQTACELCSPGTHNPHYQKRNLHHSVECDEGKHINGFGECVPCPRGTYNDGVGEPGCKPCPAGTHNYKEGGKSENDCLSCHVGRYSNPGSSVCLPCPEGSYNDKERQGSCTPCPAGTYNDGKGKITCKYCAKGTPLINIGYHTPQPGHSLCVPCEIGYFNDVEGSSTCSLCAPNSYNQAEASLSCTSCYIGEYTSGGSNPCLPCNPSCKMCHGDSKNECDDCYGDMVLDGNTCVCKKGYFENSSEVSYERRCQPCDDSCSSCEGTYDHCTSCFGDGGTILIDNKCLCIARGYVGIPNIITNKLECKKCHGLCEGCSGVLPTECIRCKNGKEINFIPPNTCRCSNNYFYNEEHDQCEQCHPFCEECTGPLSKNCISCSASIGYFAEGEPTLCVPDCYDLDGYYREGNECKCICFA